MTSSDKRELKKSFLDEWPLDRVKNMTLDEYTNLNREGSFCYWVERKTQGIGSIQGSPSFKFGIYKRDDTDKDYTANRFESDGEYAWERRHGNTPEEAFQKVKQLVLSVIENAKSNNLKAIDEIDNMWNMFKWKIAFLYSDYNVINIFSKKALKEIARKKGLESAKQKPISELHRYLIREKPEDTSYFGYTDQLWQEYNGSSESKESTKEKTTMSVDHILNNKDVSLNTILFGPPGTGKTYHTVDYALRIIDPEFYEENKGERDVLVKRFRELRITDWKKTGQIAFTTSHQSFTYEDFIEGIKPELSNEPDQVEKESKEDQQDGESQEKDNIRYTVEPGIFKKICERARQKSGGAVQDAKNKLKWSSEKFSQTEFYKVSLGDVNIPEDDKIYEYCIKENKIAIGFINDENLTDLSEGEIRNLYRERQDLEKHDCRSMAYFRHNLKRDYYVIVPDGNTQFRAIGRVVGDYEHDRDSEIRYNHFRDVEWIATDLNLSVDLIYEKGFMQKAIYYLPKKFIKPEFFIETEVDSFASKEEVKPYVLIIDEINRGNIAQIFGELITLIEEDKREGAEEEVPAILPYSKTKFTVPSNLYIIGTMNTADRSVEALDTALRRRFQFEEIPTNPQIITEEGNAENGIIEIDENSIFLPDLLKTINQRIEKILDKDHLIGHSYLLDIENWEGLKTVFQQNIIPLLEEYFYGDKGKIQLVLGKGFIEVINKGADGKDLFPSNNYNGQAMVEDRPVWKVKSEWKQGEAEFAEALALLDISN